MLFNTVFQVTVSPLYSSSSHHRHQILGQLSTRTTKVLILLYPNFHRIQSWSSLSLSASRVPGPPPEFLPLYVVSKRELAISQIRFGIQIGSICCNESSSLPILSHSVFTNPAFCCFCMAVRSCARVAPSPRRVRGEEEVQGRSVSGRASVQRMLKRKKPKVKKTFTSRQKIARFFHSFDHPAISLPPPAPSFCSYWLGQFQKFVPFHLPSLHFPHFVPFHLLSLHFPHFVPFHLLSLHFHLLSSSTVLLDLSLAGLHHFHREWKKPNQLRRKMETNFGVRVTLVTH